MPKYRSIPLPVIDGNVKSDVAADGTQVEVLTCDADKLEKAAEQPLTLGGLFARIGILAAGILVPLGIGWAIGKSRGRAALQAEIDAKMPLETGAPNIPVPLSAVQ